MFFFNSECLLIACNRTWPAACDPVSNKNEKFADAYYLRVRTTGKWTSWLCCIFWKWICHLKTKIYYLFFWCRKENIICSFSSHLPSVLWHCWLGTRKSIRPVKIEWWGVAVIIWSVVHIICIWSSWCHCIPKPHRLLRHLNPDWFFLSGTVLARLSWQSQ